MPDPNAIKATVEAYAHRHTRGTVDELLELFTDDAEAYDPVDQPPHVGREAIAAFFAANREMADSLVIELTGPVRVAGDQAAFPLVARTTIGDLSLEIDIIDVMTFDDDAMISEMRAYWSMADARSTTPR